MGFVILDAQVHCLPHVAASAKAAEYATLFRPTSYELYKLDLGALPETVYPSYVFCSIGGAASSFAGSP
jgi:hypothetical protein